MKLLKQLFIFLVLFTALSYSQTTINSTTVGGMWDSSKTWIGGTVPSASSNVVIDGPVILTYHAPPNNPNICNDLLINTTGSLKPGNYGGGAGTYILQVYGNATINGTINPILNDDRIHIHLYGDLTCNSNWTPYQTVLKGSSDRNITMAADSYAGNPFVKEGVDGKIFAGSDLEFKGDFNLGGSTLEMGNHSIIGVAPYNIYNGRIKGDFNIKGNFLVWENQSNPLYMEGTITVEDTLQNDEYGQGSIYYKLNVDGDIINNGVIKDFNFQDDRLTINVTGDITNNGIWENSITNFTGSKTQYIAQTEDMYFQRSFADLDSSSSVAANTDITILGDYSLNRSHLIMNDHQLNLSGWLYNGLLENAVLNNGHLQNITSLNTLEIKGKVVVDNGNNFEGSITITDTLQNNVYGGGSYNYNLQVNGDIVNNGIIKDDNPFGDRLILNTTGNIINNNQWTNYKTVFNGSSDQEISLKSGKMFETWFEDVDSTSSLKALTDIKNTGSIYLGRTVLDMNNYSLELNAGNSVHNGYLKNVKLKNGILSYIRLLDQIEINGLVEIGNKVDAVASIIINDTISATSYGGGTATYEITVYGSILNNGFIGNVYDDLLNVKVNGTITNKGTWNAFRNYLYFFKNHNECSVNCFNMNSTDMQFDSSSISGSGANSFAISSGGGTQAVSPNESYSVNLQFNPTGGDTTATLDISCSEIGSLSSIYLIGHNYNTIVSVEENKNKLETIPNAFKLYQNYPNPFNPSTVISYQLPAAGHVTIKVYDILGRDIATLIDEYKTTGKYEVKFNGSSLTSGIYLYQIKSGSFVQTKKMMLIK